MSWVTTGQARYEVLTEKILEIVRKGMDHGTKVMFKQIREGVRGIEKNERAVDRELQRLRRAGQLEYTQKHGWKVPTN